MQDWQQRVVEERDELEERFDKLQAMLGMPLSGLELPARMLLVEQSHYMRGYLDVLKRRIEAW